MELKRVRGTEDWTDERVQKLYCLETILRSIVDKYHFSEIRTPVFEYKDLFVRSVGDASDIVTKEMFEIVDRKDRVMVLRPEATASTVRAIIENKMYVDELPLKLFYIGPMFRYERPQAGRLRQFHQFGVEVVGAKSELLDVETILLANHIITSLGLDNVTLKLNSLGSIATREVYLKALVAYLANLKLCDDCAMRLVKNPLRVLDCKVDHDKMNDAPRIYDFLDEVDRNYFDQTVKMLDKLNIKYVIDHLLVRGLDYYSDLVFEFVVGINGTELAIIGGGRYDHLINELDSRLDYPAIGFASGLERLLLVLESQNFDFNLETSIDAYVVCLSQSARSFACSLLLMLRNAGLVCDMDYLNRNLKAQFKSVERTHANYAIIVGDEELKANKVKIKNQQTGKERLVAFDKILSSLANKEE